MQELSAEKHAWERFFSAEALTPARLFYEDFHKDVSLALGFLAREMGLALRLEVPPGTGFEKLADGLTRDWVERVQRHVFQMT
jgi:LPS sulfotransferase NodH